MTEEYPIKLEAKSAFAYNSATAIIIGLSNSRQLGEDGKMHYFLDAAKTQGVRTDISRRTIELSNRIDPETLDDIKHVLGER